jgi:hypothetical protein
VANKTDAERTQMTELNKAVSALDSTRQRIYSSAVDIVIGSYPAYKGAWREKIRLANRVKRLTQAEIELLRDALFREQSGEEWRASEEITRRLLG